jgi:hypothetical protein
MTPRLASNQVITRGMLEIVIYASRVIIVSHLPTGMPCGIVCLRSHDTI